MEISIQKWGNSAAVRLPAPLLSQLGVALGDKLSADVQAKCLVLRPARQNYTLTELMAQCDLKAAPPADMQDWADARPMGQEVW